MAAIDYTTATLIKSELHIGTNGDDALLARLATAASRATDKVCSGSADAAAGCDGYFQRQSVAAEILRAQMDAQGNILCHPRKHSIWSVSAFAYRYDPRQNWTDVDPTLVEVQGPYSVYAFTASRWGSRSNVLRVKISYDGGLGTAQTDLPADFVELVNLMGGRIYREGESGLTDAIGIATVGSVQYTKALPERYSELIKVYQRQVAFN